MGTIIPFFAPTILEVRTHGAMEYRPNTVFATHTFLHSALELHYLGVNLRFQF